MAGAAVDSTQAEDEWELCNDDGFIYKRRKRQPDEGPLPASSSAGHSAADPEAELKRNRLARRKLSLVALRDRYRKEIEKWEGLLASLHGGDRRSGGDDGGGNLHLSGEEPAQQLGVAAGSVSSSCEHQELEEIVTPENAFGNLIEELMLQVEAQEAVLKRLSDLCDIVDSACDAQEEASMESLLDLPVWGSPGALMAALTD